MNVSAPQIPLSDLKEKLHDKRILGLSRITPSLVPDVKQGNNWVTFGVIARKLPPKDSAKVLLRLYIIFFFHGFLRDDHLACGT